MSTVITPSFYWASFHLASYAPQPTPIGAIEGGVLFLLVNSVLYIRSNFQIWSRLFKNDQRSNLSKAHNHCVYHQTYVTPQESNGWPTEEISMRWGSKLYVHFPDKSDIHVCHLTHKIIYVHCFLLQMFILKQLHKLKWIYLLLIYNNPIDKHHLL